MKQRESPEQRTCCANWGWLHDPVSLVIAAPNHLLYAGWGTGYLHSIHTLLCCGMWTIKCLLQQQKLLLYLYVPLLTHSLPGSPNYRVEAEKHLSIQAQALPKIMPSNCNSSFVHSPSLSTYSLLPCFWGCISRLQFDSRCFKQIYALCGCSKLFC